MAADLDDVALLRAAHEFADEPALLLLSQSAPTLPEFCSAARSGAASPSDELRDLALVLQSTATECIAQGVSPELLSLWSDQWRSAVESQQAEDRTALAEELAISGAVRHDQTVALTAFAPLKSEWLAQYLRSLWDLLELAQDEEAAADEPVELTAAGTARATAAHYPAHLRLRTRDRPLLPAVEGRIWTLYGPYSGDLGPFAGDALGGVMTRLLELQPDVSGHLRCLTWGPGAADMLVSQAVDLLGRKVGRSVVKKIEIFCIGPLEMRPTAATLAWADGELAGEERRTLEIRYLDDLEAATSALQARTHDTPAVHLAVVAGLTAEGERLTIESPEIDPLPEDDEVLFTPRTWTRARQTRRILLAPPAASPTGAAWLRLMNAVDDAWPGEESELRVPELRTSSGDLVPELLAVHDLASWVATIDPYATRDSLTHALGEQVAILHQERRLGGDSPLSLVLSQRSGGPADRAVGRSLRAARIVDDERAALEIGGELRRVASEGYGILALEAATTGAGINELVGHVASFSLLSTRTTPWPLPPGCRLLLISLDDYKQWFPGKRADLLVMALDTEEKGVHVAIVEVKARRSDEDLAARDALDQLRQTLNLMQWAAYPRDDSLHSKLWLNRLADAACAVARESNLRLTGPELDALEQFRRGLGTLEWAGLGLVFGPRVDEVHRDYHQPVAGDRIPIVVESIRLTEERLREAATVRLTELKTVEAERAPLEGGRRRRRPERRPASERAQNGVEPEVEPPGGQEERPAQPEAEEEERQEPEPLEEPEEPEEAVVAEEPATEVANEAGEFAPPLLGWDSSSGDEIRWYAAGPEATLPNGHMEIWGSSGAGKTQFTMSLLAQLSRHGASHFGIADFKNDYGGTFPDEVGAAFIDMWDEGAPFNPLALADDSDRAITRAVIELRDIVDIATRSFTRMGHRQKDKLREALEDAYRLRRSDSGWPTLSTLNGLLDNDLIGVIGDLTRNDIFRDGPPLGDVIDENVVFGLSRIPGNGLTTILAAGFILSALQLRMQGLPPAANTIRYVTVVDEAHRVVAFKAIDTMIREGRSKGLAVVLATQQPGDLPEVVATNAQTKVCFRLPDAVVAAAAARRLDPNDPELAEQIRTLDVGEAFFSLGGDSPRLLNVVQYWRHGQELLS